MDDVCAKMHACVFAFSPVIVHYVNTVQSAFVSVFVCIEEKQSFEMSCLLQTPVMRT